MAVVLAVVAGVLCGIVGVFVAAMWVAADAGYAASPDGLAESVRGRGECDAAVGSGPVLQTVPSGAAEELGLPVARLGTSGM